MRPPESSVLEAAWAGGVFLRGSGLGPTVESAHLGDPRPWQALLGAGQQVPRPQSWLHLGASQCQDDSGKGRNLVISQLESAVKINVFWRLGGCQTHAEPNWVLKCAIPADFHGRGVCVCVPGKSGQMLTIDTHMRLDLLLGPLRSQGHGVPSATSGPSSHVLGHPSWEVTLGPMAMDLFLCPGTSSPRGKVTVTAVVTVPDCPCAQHCASPLHILAHLNRHFARAQGVRTKCDSAPSPRELAAGLGRTPETALAPVLLKANVTWASSCCRAPLRDAGPRSTARLCDTCTSFLGSGLLPHWRIGPTAALGPPGSQPQVPLSNLASSSWLFNCKVGPRHVGVAMQS